MYVGMMTTITNKITRGLGTRIWYLLNKWYLIRVPMTNSPAILGWTIEILTNFMKYHRKVSCDPTMGALILKFNYPQNNILARLNPILLMCIIYLIAICYGYSLSLCVTAKRRVISNMCLWSPFSFNSSLMRFHRLWLWLASRAVSFILHCVYLNPGSCNEIPLQYTHLIPISLYLSYQLWFNLVKKFYN